MQFGIYSSTIIDKSVWHSIFSVTGTYGPVSVTGGSSDLTIVLGWNVVIKYVLITPSLLYYFVLIPPSLFYMPGTSILFSIVRSIKLLLGTIIGAFIVDYLGPKYTMVSVVAFSFTKATDESIQIFGLIAQAIVGFFMSGFYLQ